MEGKNLILAISLSALVLIMWSIFFVPPPPTIDKNQNKIEKIQEKNDISSPSIETTKKIKTVSRAKSLKTTKRIPVENENIIGSISLTGGIVDDIIFKNYTQNINSEEKVILLSPNGLDEGYYIETGWASTNKNIDLPNNKTEWSTVGNSKLTPNNPVTLKWTNDKQITFLKTIELDEKFLFKVKQQIKNDGNNKYDFYPYAQIVRDKKPKVLGYYILHEGFIGVFDEELKEEDYKDIEEKKFTANSYSGWLGITDKYWITAIVPEKNRNFKSEFIYDKNYRANFIQTEPIQSSPNQTISSEIRVFTAAKEVDVIDSYAKNQKIEKFDLTIDWGWFYFFTKPLFFVADYFFKLTGNFGFAIILITACIRLIFFPLANYSFKSMAKMKVLQPEMVRLKELHKDDKVKLQQEMMALYKREKVNPISGCLPVLIQIPFFFAIYKMLFVTIEMRQQPFFGWIQDLSARDPTSVFNLFGLIPWDPPTFLMIGAWPIMMGFTMYIQQKLNPTPPDPIQAKIFMFFPLFLTIVLAPFPSGLVVYWTINNILTMAQQWIIIKRTSVKTV
jgi:YidC/Oxa1 family membrane protein insertase